MEPNLKLEKLKEEAIERILSLPFAVPTGVYVGHSGGKDSVVVHYLAKEALGEDVPVYHNVKKETHPDTEDFVRTIPNVVYLGAGQVPPLGAQIDGTRKYEYDRVDGRSTDYVSGGENLNRVNLDSPYVENGLFGKNFIYPIYDWTDEDVWDFITYFNIPFSKEYVNKCLIIAPHPDDELIGCFSVLRDIRNDVDVYVAYDLTKERQAELNLCAERFGFTVVSSIDATVYDKVYVPSRNDWHRQHKELYVRYQNIATHFYSVDMVGGSPLPYALQQEKLDALNFIYPSQSALWERDHRYFLFESIQEVDYEEYATIQLREVTCTVRSKYAGDVYNEVMQRNVTGLDDLAKLIIPIVGATPMTLQLGNIKREYR